VEQAAEIVVQIPPLAVRPEVAAAMLGLGESTLRELLRSGAIRGRKAGDCPRSAVLVPIAELERWLHGRPVTGPAAPDRSTT